MSSLDLPPRPGASFAAELQEALVGRVVAGGDFDYDDLRRVFNGMVDRRPSVIARVATGEDVAASLAFARERGIALAVRGAGHAPCGQGVVDDGLVVDLRPLKFVGVDVAAQTVRAGAGVTWAELDAATQQVGLAVTGARVSSIGVAGSVLGSGSGWLERSMGLAADSLRSARVVVADGREVVASARSHPELFWALRGGGGGFGVVTEVELGLRRLGPTVRGGVRFYPYERAGEVLAAYRDALRHAPDELCGGVALVLAPASPLVPDEIHGRPAVAVVVVWAGAPEDADDGIAPLDALGTPCVDLVADMPYAAVQTLFDDTSPAGARSYLRSGFLTDLSDDAISAFVALGGELQGEWSHILLQPLGGAYGRVDPGATALGARDAGWAFQLLSLWARPSADAEEIAWTRAAAAELSDHATGAVFPNFLTRDGGQYAWDPAAHARLNAAKAVWDPDRVLRGLGV